MSLKLCVRLLSLKFFVSAAAKRSSRNRSTPTKLRKDHVRARRSRQQANNLTRFFTSLDSQKLLKSPNHSSKAWFASGSLGTSGRERGVLLQWGERWAYSSVSASPVILT